MIHAPHPPGWGASKHASFKSKNKVDQTETCLVQIAWTTQSGEHKVHGEVWGEHKECGELNGKEESHQSVSDDLH